MTQTTSTQGTPNLREAWGELQEGPKGTHWKFSADASPELRELYGNAAEILLLTLQKNPLTEKEKKAIHELLDGDIAIGHNEWAEPFTSYKEKWISFPKNSDHTIFEDSVFHELGHIFEKSSTLHPQDARDKPSKSKFTKTFPGEDKSSLLDKNLEPDINTVSNAQKLAQDQKMTQHGQYVLDYEIKAVWTNNFIDRMILGSSVNKRDEYHHIPDNDLGSMLEMLKKKPDIQQNIRPEL